MDAYERRAIEFARRDSDRFAELLADGVAPESHAAALVRSRFYAALAAATRASYILAVGDSLVHAGFHVADGFGPTGRLDLVVADPDVARNVTTAIGRHSLGEFVRVHNANAVAVVSNLNGPFDLVLADLPPDDAGPIYEHFVRLLRVGGSLAITLPEPPQAEADSADAWLQHLANDERLYVHIPATQSPAVAVRRR